MILLPEVNDVYYDVNNERYTSKLAALMRATELKKPIRWNFHNDVFDKVPWSLPPSNLNLIELYRERAKRLRETYDYLILSYSGGSDSWTVLQAFLNQGIWPDEIMTSVPKKFLDRYNQPDATDDSAENHYDEWAFQQERNLKWIATHFPQIKITLLDFTDDLLKEIQYDDYHRANGVLHPVVMRKLMFVDHKHVLDMQSQGKKVGAITGNDKPQLMFKDNKYYMYFLDKLAGHCSDFPGATLERFFWSPDAIDILRAQSWLVYTHFKVNTNLNPMIAVPRSDFSLKHLYDDLVRSIVYTQWSEVNSKAAFFVTKKNRFVMHSETASIFDGYLAQNDAYSSWKSQIGEFFSKIDPSYYEYVDGKLDNIVGCISNVYYIGDA